MKFAKDAWLPLRVFSYPRVYRTASTAVISIPLFANVIAATSDGQSSGFRLSGLMSLFDNEDLFLPTNMSRVFWAAIIFSIVGVLFFLFAPETVKHINMENWLSSRNGKARISKIKDKHPDFSDAQARLAAKNYYETNDIPFWSPRNFPLIVSWLMLLVGAYLCALVINDQAVLIAGQQDWMKLVSPKRWGI